jgi:hypothetical protein
MNKLVHLAIVVSLLTATAPAALAKNPFAPGQLGNRSAAVQNVLLERFFKNGIQLLPICTDTIIVRGFIRKNWP